MKKLLVIASLLLVFTTCSKTEVDPSNTDQIAIITTDFGEIHILLYDETPLHKANFLKLASEGFYDSTTFHRVMEGFMIQGGDPNSKDDIPFNDGQGGPGYTIEAEFSQNLIHKKGAIAAARTGDQQNPERRSSGSQFYIVQGEPVQSILLDQMQEQRNKNEKEIILRDYMQAPEQAELLNKLRGFMQAGLQDSIAAELARLEPIVTAGYVPFTYSPEQRDLYANLGGAPFLDGNYTVFGEVIKGLAVVDSIATVETGQADRPIENVVMMVSVETLSKAKIEADYGYTYQ
jgi:cyclophilin family peptidyl-prolyl cis-trans isomerase